MTKKKNNKKNKISKQNGEVIHSYNCMENTLKTVKNVIKNTQINYCRCDIEELGLSELIHCGLEDIDIFIDAKSIEFIENLSTNSKFFKEDTVVMEVSDLMDLMKSSYKDGFTEGLHEGTLLEQVKQFKELEQFEFKELEEFEKEEF